LSSKKYSIISKISIRDPIDKKRTSHSERLIRNRDLLSLNEHLHKNSHHTSILIKDELVLTSATRSITRYCNKLGWKKIRTRYCQLVSPNNQIKRFIDACLLKIIMKLKKKNIK
jgi:hypothetical protein